MKDVGNKYPFRIVWTLPLMQDLKAEIFDVYFRHTIAANKFLQILSTRRLPLEWKPLEPLKSPTKDGKPPLNGAEAGRLCYLLQLAPADFNAIFGFRINATNIPSTAENFCKKTTNQEKTNIFNTVAKIFSKHNIPIFYPGQTAEEIHEQADQEAQDHKTSILSLEAQIQEENQAHAIRQSYYNQMLSFHTPKPSSPKTPTQPPQPPTPPPLPPPAKPTQPTLFD